MDALIKLVGRKKTADAVTGAQKKKKMPFSLQKGFEPVVM